MARSGGGKRAGSRRGQRPPRRFQPALLLLALGITACIVAWGYLVYAAIDFGTTARDGDQNAWWFLAVASVGAVACLFVGLMLVARVLRRLGITSGGPAPSGADRRAHFPVLRRGRHGASRRRATRGALSLGPETPDDTQRHPETPRGAGPSGPAPRLPRLASRGRSG